MAAKFLGKTRLRTRRATVEHERLLSLVNSMADGVIAIDRHLKVVLSNGAALNILDVNSSMHEKFFASVFKPMDKNNQPVDVDELVRNAKIPTATRDYHLDLADGSKINIYLSIAPVHLGFRARGH